MTTHETKTRKHRRHGLLPWVVLGMASVAVVVVAQTGRDGGEIEGVETYEYIGGLHTEAEVPYTENPPTGGPHDPVWQNCGTYTEELREEHVVHSMEHGAVWVTYRPGSLTETQTRELAERLEGRRYVILSPRASQDAPIALSAWNRQLTVTEHDDPRIGIFAARYAEGPQAPESGAPCDGGTSTTLGEDLDRSTSGSMDGVTGNTGDETNGATGSDADDKSERGAGDEQGAGDQGAVPVNGLNDDLVGIGEDEARRIVESRGMSWRVEERDGETSMITQEYDETRITAVVENGVVVRVRIG